MVEKQEQEVHIDLKRLFFALLGRKGWILLTAVLCAAAALLGTLLLITPEYQSAVKFYAINSTSSTAQTDGISVSDISASRELVQTCIVILDVRQTLQEIIDCAGADCTIRELEKMVSAEAVDATEIFRILVTGEDPEEAAQIANAIAYILPARIREVMGGTSIKVLEYAVPAEKPATPNYLQNTLLGFVLGLALGITAAAARALTDTTIRREEDTAFVQLPILAAVPERGSGEEELRLLRTGVLCAFREQNACFVLGVTGILRGEGKTDIAHRLAGSLRRAGKRILLVGGPSRTAPGLAEVLTGQCSLNGALTAGDGVELLPWGRSDTLPDLLCGGEMAEQMRALRSSYDAIVLDFPSLEESCDALSAANLTDGMLLTLREDRCRREDLQTAADRLRRVQANILGLVYLGT